MTTFQTYVLFPCKCGCGKVIKIDISKYTKRVQRGLQKDYGFRPTPINDSHVERHQCPVCHKTCKAENGAGTQAALEIERFSEVHQYIMRALAAHGRANLDELRLFLDVSFDYKTTANTLHSRISDLKAWNIVTTEEIEGSTKPTGLDYESSHAVVYRIDTVRAQIVEKDNWQTWRLRVIDSGASYKLEGFVQA